MLPCVAMAALQYFLKGVEMSTSPEYKRKYSPVVHKCIILCHSEGEQAVYFQAGSGLLVGGAQNQSWAGQVKGGSTMVSNNRGHHPALFQSQYIPVLGRKHGMCTK